MCPVHISVVFAQWNTERSSVSLMQEKYFSHFKKLNMDSAPLSESGNGFFGEVISCQGEFKICIYPTILSVSHTRRA